MSVSDGFSVLVYLRMFLSCFHFWRITSESKLNWQVFFFPGILNMLFWCLSVSTVLNEKLPLILPLSLCVWCVSSFLDVFKIVSLSLSSSNLSMAWLGAISLCLSFLGLIEILDFVKYCSTPNLDCYFFKKIFFLPPSLFFLAIPITHLLGHFIFSIGLWCSANFSTYFILSFGQIRSLLLIHWQVY